MINKIKEFIRVPYLPYFLFLSVMVIVSTIIFYQLDKNISSNISNNSALYLLSAMAQALASILAIVLGFSFVAVQVSAQIWSPRVFDLILKGRALWSLLVIYGFSISFDLLLLRTLPEGKIDNMFLVSSINFSIFLTFFSIVSLFPYAYNTIELLKPEKMIQGIIKIKYDNEEALNRDVILPIVDIMNKAINADDPHTLKFGLDELEKLNLDMLKSKINSGYKLKIAKYYSGKNYRLVENAFNQNDEDSVIEITDSLKNIGTTSIKMRWSEVPPDEIERIKSDGKFLGIGIPGKTDNYDLIASEIKIVLSAVCNRVIKKEWSRATKSILNAKGSLIVISHEEHALEMISLMPDAFQILNDFLCLSEKGKIFSLNYFIEAIRNILIEMINKDIFYDEISYDYAIKLFFKNSLQLIGEDEVELRQTISYITDIGIEAAEKEHKFKDNIKDILISATADKYFNVIFGIANKGHGVASSIWICSCLKEIGVFCILKKMDDPTKEIFHFLSVIESNYRGTKSGVTEKIVEIIKEIGYKSIDSELEKSSSEAMNSLILIGMMNGDISIKTQICRIIKDMQGRLVNKEIFKSIMEINEKAQGYELVKFQEFKKFCDLDTIKHPR